MSGFNGSVRLVRVPTLVAILLLEKVAMRSQLEYKVKYIEDEKNDGGAAREVENKFERVLVGELKGGVERSRDDERSSCDGHERGHS